jgi:serine protease Do
MSDERWNAETTENQFTAESSGTDDKNIIDSTAEVVSEASSRASEPVHDYEYKTQNTAAYENYSRDAAAGGTYAHADQGSATGNGNYNYENSTHEYYQGGNYGSSMGGGRSGGGSNGRGKGFLVVVLAIVFGVCIGAGFWGVHRYLGNKGLTADAAITESADNKDSSLTGEKKQEAAVEDKQDDTAAAEQNEPAAKDAVPENKQETPAAAESADPVQQQASDKTEREGIKNEAGLIIADSETPDTELTKVVDKVMPSIVSVYNDFTEEVQNFYGQTFTRQGESTGSGIIIGKTDNELLIVTNNHVVEGADHLRVLFIDQETCDAEIKGTDPSNDLAVIAVSLSNIKDTTQNQIKVATLGNSDSLKIGEDVIAIGNALGYGQSVTTGIVSANNREINDDTITGTFIQTDAAINPGNSGGALVNINGYVIGINSSKIGGNAVEGMGFAIPISRAIPIIEELMSHETLSKVDESEQGTIGISGATVTSDVAKAYNMPQGVYVAQIIENGGAANSELREGDIITAIDSQTVSSMEELQRRLQYYKAGTEVTLTVQRQDGKGSYAETAVKVTLGTRESLQNTNPQNNQPQQGSQPQQGNQPQQGGQNDQNGYNSQGESDATIDQDIADLFRQFGFSFGN